MPVSRRLVFGEIADEYDRHRPDYPPELVDDLLSLARIVAGDRVLEIGAGTGKATAMFVGHGIPVLAVEPSATMAAVARRKLAASGLVEIVETDFEQFSAGRDRYKLVYCAQAWHWVDPRQRYLLARAALRPGGVLAVFGNYPIWEDSPLRAELAQVYARVAPDMPVGPMHPADRSGIEPHPGWDDEVEAAAGLAVPSHRTYRWTAEYEASDYAGLVGTHSATRLIAADARAKLLAEIENTVRRHGGRVRLSVATLLDLARAV